MNSKVEAKLSGIVEPETPRLRLRQWREEDRAPFAAMNADEEVMRYFPATLDRTASDAFAEHCESRIANRGWGLWAVELRASGEFMGFIGLEVPNYELPFSPCTEVGWRLGRAFWGSGYATEGATAALRAGFELLQLEEVVSFTTLANTRSRRVMEKLGMQDTANDFMHPAVAEGSPLRPHCLYRMSRENWLARTRAAAQQ